MVKRLMFLLLLLNLASAIEIENAKIVSSIEGTIVDSGKVYAIGGNLVSLELNNSIPQSRDNQFVTYAGNTVTDSEGNAYANLKSGNPANPFSYSIVTNIKISSRTTKELPATYTIPSEYSIYTKASDYAQSENKDIKDLAKVITANSADDYERVAKLAIWVHNYVTYDINLVGETKDAAWVLQNKKGVCVEYTTLFIALTRSLGIPAKFVSGYSYSQFNNWLGHQWAEVYVGRWIPVDPTWLEVGHLDATHIEIFKSYKRDEPNWVYAFISNQNADIKWERDLKFGGEANAVRINTLAFEKPLHYELKSTDKTLNFGDKALVYVKIKSDDYRVVDLTLLPCSGEPQILKQQEKQKYAILRPNEETIIPWVVEAETNLDRSYEYTCPVTLNSPYLGSISLSLEAKPMLNEKTNFDAWFGKEVLGLGEEQTVFYAPHSIPANAVIGYISDYSETSNAVVNKQPNSFSFKPKKLGLNNVYIYSSTGEVKELHFNVISNVSLIIQNISIQNFAVLGTTTSVNVTVANKAKSIAKVKISVSIDEKEESQLVDLIGEKTIGFLIPTSNAGARNVTITAEANDLTAEQRSIVNVYEIPEVKIGKINYQYSGNKTKMVFLLQTSNDPSNIILRVNDIQLSGKEGSNEIELVPGKYTLRVEWQDPEGKWYYTEQNIDVPKENLINNLAGPCLPLLVLIALIFLAKRDK